MLGWLVNVNIHNQGIMVDGFARIAEMRRDLASLQAEVAGIAATIHQDVAHVPPSRAQHRQNKRSEVGATRKDQQIKSCKVSSAAPSTSTQIHEEIMVLKKEDFKAFDSKCIFLLLHSNSKMLHCIFLSIIALSVAIHCSNGYIYPESKALVTICCRVHTCRFVGRMGSRVCHQAR